MFDDDSPEKGKQEKPFFHAQKSTAPLLFLNVSKRRKKNINKHRDVKNK
jgi:hypothetical protein